MHKKILLLGLVLLILPVIANAQEIEYYYGEECPYCHKMAEFLETEIMLDYPDLIINKYETWHDQENSQALTAVFDSHEIDPNNRGVPALIIGEELIIGNRQEQVATAIANLVGTGEIIQENPVQEQKQEPEPVAQASVITTYGAWVLVALVIVGIFSLIIFKRKEKDEEPKSEVSSPESKE